MRAPASTARSHRGGKDERYRQRNSRTDSATEAEGAEFSDPKFGAGAGLRRRVIGYHVSPPRRRPIAGSQHRPILPEPQPRSVVRIFLDNEPDSD
jgi:hypothetical protein